MPIITYEGGHGLGDDEAAVPRLLSIDLYPVTLGHGQPLYHRGSPEMARGEEARQILQNLARLSQPYGTEIVIEGEIGRVVLG